MLALLILGFRQISGLYCRQFGRVQGGRSHSPAPGEYRVQYLRHKVFTHERVSANTVTGIAAVPAIRVHDANGAR